MDYRKFNRTNLIIELVGSVIAAVWSVIGLFFAEGYYAFAAFMPVYLAFIIKSVRVIALTEREDYAQESYAESKKTSYTDNRTLYIISAVCSCVALVLVTIKAFVL